MADSSPPPMTSFDQRPRAIGERVLVGAVEGVHGDREGHARRRDERDRRCARRLPERGGLSPTAPQLRTLCVVMIVSPLARPTRSGVARPHAGSPDSLTGLGRQARRAVDLVAGDGRAAVEGWCRPESGTLPSPASAERPVGAPGGPLGGGDPSMVTLKRCSTASIGLAIVRPSPPANSKAHGVVGASGDDERARISGGTERD